MTNYLKLVSIEIGNIADNVVSATFSNQIVSLDFSAGITIKVNGSVVQILSVKRLNDQKTFQYTISQSVISTDTVTFKYLSLPSALSGIGKSSMYGDYVSSEYGTVVLEDIGLLTVINNVPSQGDPIGDALRADAKTSWKMDETSGTRADATGRGNSLSDVNSNVSGVAGKVSNAAQFVGGVSTGVLRINSNADVSIDPLLPFYLFTWVKLNLAQISANGIVLFQKGLDSLGEFEYSLIYYHPTQIFTFYNYNSFEAQSAVVADATWYFIEVIYDPSLGDFGQLGIAVNNGAFVMADFFEGGISTFAHPLHVGNDDDNNFVGAGLIDESGILHRLPTSQERAYLYNSGVGRTLYP